MSAPSEAATGGPVAAGLRERRLFRRYGLRMAARLLGPSGAVDCVVHDLSLGGAGLSPALPQLAEEPLRLAWEGLDLPNGLPCRVVRTTEHRTHLTFELDPEAEDALTMFLLTRAPTLG